MDVNEYEDDETPKSGDKGRSLGMEHSGGYDYDNDGQEVLKSRVGVWSRSLEHTGDGNDCDRDNSSKWVKYGDKFRVHGADKDGVKLREEVQGCSLDYKSDDNDCDRDDRLKRVRYGDDVSIRGANRVGKEIGKSREEIQGRSPEEHKSDGYDSDHGDRSKWVKHGNEPTTSDANKDGMKTREVWSYSPDFSSDGYDTDRGRHTKRVKSGNDSRSSDAFKDGVKARKIQSRSPDFKSGGYGSDRGGHSKRDKYGNESRYRDSNRTTESSGHRFTSRDRDRERWRVSVEYRERERGRDRHRYREDTYERDRERVRYRDQDREQEWNGESNWERRGGNHDDERDRERKFSHPCRIISRSYQDQDVTEKSRGKDRKHDWEGRNHDRDGQSDAEMDMDMDRECSGRCGTPLERYEDRDETETSGGQACKLIDKELVEGDRECSRERGVGVDLEADLLPCSRAKEDRADLDADSLSCSRTKEDRVGLEADPDCDRRTVFAYQVSLKADKRDVFEFFSKAGEVCDVRLIMGSNPGIAEGTWCIEFYDTVSVPMAIELSGQPLLSQPVIVKPSEHENNVQSTTQVAVTDGLEPYSEGPGRLYVNNLHVNIREDQLRQVFEPFGEVALVRLSMDRNGQCRGFGFVQFARLENARNAQTLDGNLEIAGRIVKVSPVADKNRTLAVETDTADAVHDDEDVLSLNGHSLEILMQKLDHDGTLSSISDILNTPIINSIGAPNLGTASFISAQILAQNSILAPAVLLGTSIHVPAAAIPSIDTIGTPSECLLLKSMFDPKLEMDPDFFPEVRTDVKDECSRFGNVKHIFVDKKSAGLVYIRFDKIKSAISAQHALHGRWFSGIMVTASFVDPQLYETKFRRNR